MYTMNYYARVILQQSEKQVTARTWLPIIHFPANSVH